LKSNNPPNFSVLKERVNLKSHKTNPPIFELWSLSANTFEKQKIEYSQTCEHELLHYMSE